MPIHAKHKGNAFELRIVKILKELGWTRACSSRAESKSKDDQKIDICYVDPLNVQAKAVEKLGNYHTVLNSMPKDDNINVVWHKRNRQGSVIAMSESDFLKILNILIEVGKIKPC